jgi:hypothetical protein
VELAVLQPLHQFLEQLPYMLVAVAVAQVQLVAQQEQVVQVQVVAVVALALAQQPIQALVVAEAEAYQEAPNQLAVQVAQA